MNPYLAHNTPQKSDRNWRWSWRNDNHPPFLYSDTMKTYKDIRKTMEAERYEDLVFLVGQDMKVHSLGTKGSATKGSYRYDYPFDSSNVMGVQDFFGAHAAQSKARPLGVRAAWRLVGFFREAVNKRSQAVRTIPFQIFRGKNVIYDSMYTAKLPMILKWMRGDKMKGTATFSDLIELTIESMVLEGRAAWGLDYMRGGLMGVYWWSPDYWEARYSETYTHIDGIYRHVGRERDKGFMRNLDTVCLFFDRDPYCEAGPPEVSSGQAAAIHASVLNGVDRFLNVHMRRGLLKATIILVPRNTKDEERRAFNTRFANFMGFGKKRHITLEADSVDVKELGEGLADLSDGTVERQQKESMLNALGVPHGLMLSGQTASKMTAEEDIRKFYDQTVLPDANKFAKEVNEQIFEDMGLRFAFCYNRLSVRRKAMLMEAKEWQILTKNQQVVSSQYAREEMGIAELDVYLEEEIEEQRQRALELMQSAPGGDAEGGNKPDTQDPKQETSREENDSDRDREKKPDSERENDEDMDDDDE